jgi:hypothetical protein
MQTVGGREGHLKRLKYQPPGLCKFAVTYKILIIPPTAKFWIRAWRKRKGRKEEMVMSPQILKHGVAYEYRRIRKCKSVTRE